MTATWRQLAIILPLAAAMPAFCAGCGWEPLYANRETSATAADLSTITVSPISDRIGQQLEFALRDSLNPSHETAKPLYTLVVTLSKSLYDSGIQSQGLGTRGDINLGATYQLVENATHKIVQTGSVHASDSFDIQANGYSTIVAQNDATTRDIEEVRREIVVRLTLFMQSKGAAAS